MGNLVSRGGTGFGYDQANRLVQVTRGTTSTRYVYDGDGKLVRDTYCDCEAIEKVYDVMPRLPAPIGSGRMPAREGRPC